MLLFCWSNVFVFNLINVIVDINWTNYVPYIKKSLETYSNCSLYNRHISTNIINVNNVFIIVYV